MVTKYLDLNLIIKQDKLNPRNMLQTIKNIHVVRK